MRVTRPDAHADIESIKIPRARPKLFLHTILLIHSPPIFGKGLKAERGTAAIEVALIFDRLGNQLAVWAACWVRAVELFFAFGEEDAVSQVRKVRGFDLAGAHFFHQLESLALKGHI